MVSETQQMGMDYSSKWLQEINPVAMALEDCKYNIVLTL